MVLPPRLSTAFANINYSMESLDTVEEQYILESIGAFLRDLSWNFNEVQLYIEEREENEAAINQGASSSSGGGLDSLNLENETLKQQMYEMGERIKESERQQNNMETFSSAPEMTKLHETNIALNRELEHTIRQLRLMQSRCEEDKMTLNNRLEECLQEVENRQYNSNTYDGSAEQFDRQKYEDEIFQLKEANYIALTQNENYNQQFADELFALEERMRIEKDDIVTNGLYHLKAYTDEIENLKRELEYMRGISEALETENRRLDSELIQYQEFQVGGMDQSSLAAHLNNLQERIAILTSTCGNGNNDDISYAQLSDRMTTLQTEYNEILIANTEISNRMNISERTYSQNISNYEQNIYSLNERINGVIEENEVLRNKCDTLQDLVQSASRQLSDMIGIKRDGEEEVRNNFEHTLNIRKHALGSYEEFASQVSIKSGREFLQKLALLLDIENTESNGMTLTRILFFIVSISTYFDLTDVQNFIAGRTFEIHANLVYQSTNIASLFNSLTQMEPYTQRYNMRDYCNSAIHGLGNLYDQGLKNNENFLNSQRKNTILIYDVDTLKKLKQAKELDLM